MNNIFDLIIFLPLFQATAWYFYVTVADYIKLCMADKGAKKCGETCGNTGNGLTSFPVFSLFSRIFQNPVTFWLPQPGTVYLSQATSKPL